MGLNIEQRSSDSPFIERVWRSRSENISSFVSAAVSQWELVVWTAQGKTQAALQGPATWAGRAPVPEDAEFFGIVFRLGVYLPCIPASQLLNRDAPLPDAAGQSFWLMGSAWHFPDYDNAETFVHRLLRQGVLAHEPVVDAVLRGQQPEMSVRSVQRRFRYAAGLDYRTIQQIERARRAAILLHEGTSILDTVEAAGYFDQAHLTRSLRQFVGQTPAQLRDEDRREQLSLLYKTAAFDGFML